MCEIAPRLYLASYTGAKELVKRFPAICAVNCTNDLPRVCSADSCIRLGVDDDMSAESQRTMILAFEPVTGQINTWLSDGKTVVVHCLAGQQRSPAVAAAYLLKYADLSLEEAVRHIRAKRPDAFFWQINFRDALERWAQLIGKPLSMVR